jgi:hypothetical protein
MPPEVDQSKWSGEGEFTQRLVDHLRALPTIRAIHVEDAPATRSGADYNFVSNEVFVALARPQTMGGLETALTAIADVGAPDYADEGMLQYLRTERIIPPYQTRGYKIVELVRIYELGSPRRD